MNVCCFCSSSTSRFRVYQVIIKTLSVSLEIQPPPEKVWTVKETVVTSSVCVILAIVMIIVAVAVYVGIARKNRRQMNGKVNFFPFMT